ncbi:hypothetical protein ACFU93_27150 [Streptomyces sp. NPDC057611]|uniref:hypothetical protein n=1 Tax=Streptomyces sp. NPDC057611 TaxID=3346182 RepID=UPI0036766434
MSMRRAGVEHEGGRFRRSHLVPVPEVDTLAELNEKIERIEVAEDVRHIDNRPTPRELGTTDGFIPLTQPMQTLPIRED